MSLPSAGEDTTSHAGENITCSRVIGVKLPGTKRGTLRDLGVLEMFAIIRNTRLSCLIYFIHSST